MAFDVGDDYEHCKLTASSMRAKNMYPFSIKSSSVLMEKTKFHMWNAGVINKKYNCFCIYSVKENKRVVPVHVKTMFRRRNGQKNFMFIHVMEFILHSSFPFLIFVIIIPICILHFYHTWFSCNTPWKRIEGVEV